MCSTDASVKAPVNKIIPFSSVDGPGNRTAIFLQGCNFKCAYCHNPETISACIHCGACVKACPAGALQMENGRVVYDICKCTLCDACIKACKNMASPRIRWMDADAVLHEVEKNRPFVRGITISGGECTLHRNFLLELAQKAKAAGLHVLLDSNGSYDFSADPELVSAIDGVMLDVKAWDEAVHFKLTGISNAMVRENLSYLAQAGKLEEVRSVIAPGVMDAEATVENVSRILAAHGGNIRYKLIQYRPMGVRAQFKETLRIPENEYIQSLAAKANASGAANVGIL